MRIKDLISDGNNIDIFKDMQLSDALVVLAEMMDDGMLSTKEINIIEQMMDSLFDNEQDDLQPKSNFGAVRDTDDQDMTVIDDIVKYDAFKDKYHLVKDSNYIYQESVESNDTHAHKIANFEKTSMRDRLEKRISQRQNRRSSTFKINARKRAAAAKNCKGPNKSVQLTQRGSGVYTCKLKDRFRSKLMQRVARRYR